MRWSRRSVPIACARPRPVARTNGLRGGATPNAHQTTVRSPATVRLPMRRLDHRMPPIDDVRDGHHSDDDQDQRYQSRANPDSCAKPAAASHAGVRVVSIRLVVEYMHHFVANLPVGPLEGLQSDPKLRLLRAGPRDGARDALPVAQPACQVGELS